MTNKFMHFASQPLAQSLKTRGKRLVDELNRLVRLAELDAYLAELEAERGPITEEEACRPCSTLPYGDQIRSNVGAAGLNG